MNFLDLNLTLWLINKTIEHKPVIMWMVDLIKHSTTNKTNSNNNWCLTNHKGEIFIEVHITDLMDLKLHLWLISKTIKTKTKRRNILLIVWMVALIKHSTTNKKNSNNNWCWTNHKGEIFIEVHIMDFKDLKLHLWLISKTDRKSVV